ncbi:chromatin modification-related protein eaf6-like [Andrographis paniculata]|uniref:chromatin modification-related protein eaf6-like n=1 Tax=Andrographis paniculata TaxID=175694 RepID=UPI0021E91B96|nr:chromatin modification-related protein eaf6-like [Andrographis paniculata]
MELQGHRGSNNPKMMLSSVLSKREKLQDELRSVEKQVYELETSYLQGTSTFGNALKGFDGFLSSSKNTANLKRSRKFQLEDRIFSLSSVTSPAAEELRAGKEDGKSDMVQGRPKAGGGLTAVAPGKPKKGRGGQREVKKMKASGEVDPDEEDDLDLR